MITKAILVSLTLANLISFVWALRAFFKIPATGMPKGMRQLQQLGSVVGLLDIYFLVIAKAMSLPGTIVTATVYVVSLTLFWWAIRTNAKKPLAVAYSETSPSHRSQWPISTDPTPFLHFVYACLGCTLYCDAKFSSKHRGGGIECPLLFDGSQRGKTLRFLSFK